MFAVRDAVMEREARSAAAGRIIAIVECTTGMWSWKIVRGIEGVDRCEGEVEVVIVRLHGSLAKNYLRSAPLRGSSVGKCCNCESYVAPYSVHRSTDADKSESKHDVKIEKAGSLNEVLRIGALVLTSISDLCAGKVHCSQILPMHKHPKMES